MDTSTNSSASWQLASSTSNSTWLERLLLNLLSYSLVLGPMAFIIVVTRFNLCTSSWQSNQLIRWFVYGGNQTFKTPSEDRDNKKLLEDGTTKRRLTSKNGRSSSKSRTHLTFVGCFLGLQLSYLCWGLLQEKIMTTKYRISSSMTMDSQIMFSKINATHDNLAQNVSTVPPNEFTFHDSQFLVFLNRIIAFILAIIALVYNRPKQSKLFSSPHYIQAKTIPPEKPSAPLYEYVYCSLTNILSSWCQLEALKYVNFPTQVLSKSFKTVPVMLMSKIMLKKRYENSDYICAILLSCGMFIFLVNQAGDLKHGPESKVNISSSIQQKAIGDSSDSQNSIFLNGLVILALYLAFDSFTSNWQQRIFSRYDVSQWQMMAATNFYSIILTLTSLHQLGHLAPAIRLILLSPTLLKDCLLMSTASAVGQLFVFFTIKQFGSVCFSLIMTFRQLVAILLSCAIYGHQLTLGSVIGIMVVILIGVFHQWHKSSKVRKVKTESSSSV